MSTKVFSYRIQGNPQPLNVVQDYLDESHFYLNELRKIGLEQRDTIDDLLFDTYPIMQVAQQEAEEAWDSYLLAEDELKTQHQNEGRSGKTLLDKEVARLKKVANTIRTKFYTLKKQLRRQLEKDTELAAGEPLVRLSEEYAVLEVKGNSLKAKKLNEAIANQFMLLGMNPQAIDLEANRKIKELYHSSNLPWSQKEALLDDYRRCCKTGHIKLASVSDSGYLWIRTQTSSDLKNSLRAGDLYSIGKKRRVPIEIRLGIDKQPTWVNFTLILHRPLPTNGRIAGIKLVKTMIATKTYWHLQFTCVKNSPMLDNGNQEKVGFDLGWRSLETGIHVASWWGSHGDGCLVIPWERIRAWELFDTMQSERDTVFNAITTSLREWVKTHTVPSWLSDRLQHAHSWRSQSRLTKLIEYWSKHRFDGDSSIYVLLNGDGKKHPRLCRDHYRLSYTGWRNWDKHKYERIAQQKQKWIRWRKDLYHNIACQLAKVYGVFKFEDACMKQLDRKNSIDQVSNDAMRKYKRLAAPGLFREIFKSKAAHWEYVESKGTTSICNSCKCWIDFGSKLEAQCPGCGKVWNRDENAPRNICQSTKIVKSGPVEKQSTRFQKKYKKQLV